VRTVRATCRRHVALEISPGSRDERATAIRQDEDEMQLIASMGPPEHGKGLALKGVAWSGDGDARRETFEVGTVWLFPSTPSITNSSCGRCGSIPTVGGSFSTWSGGSGAGTT
jgi:hypothetical protein